MDFGKSQTCMGATLCLGQLDLQRVRPPISFIDICQSADAGRLNAIFLVFAGALYATNIGAFYPLGMEGWRFAFLSVGIVR